MIWKINNEGNLYYEKLRKDSKQGIFLYVPLMLVFYLGIGLGIYGVGLKYFLISIFPVLLILKVFVSPVFARKKYINNLIKEISTEGGRVSINTYGWFNHPSISFSFESSSADLSKVRDQSFFIGKEVCILTFKNDTLNKFYLISEFSDVSIIQLATGINIHNQR